MNSECAEEVFKETLSLPCFIFIFIFVFVSHSTVFPGTERELRRRVPVTLLANHCYLRARS